MPCVVLVEGELRILSIIPGPRAPSLSPGAACASQALGVSDTRGGRGAEEDIGMSPASSSLGLHLPWGFPSLTRPLCPYSLSAVPTATTPVTYPAL